MKIMSGSANVSFSPELLKPRTISFASAKRTHWGSSNVNYKASKILNKRAFVRLTLMISVKKDVE